MSGEANCADILKFPALSKTTVPSAQLTVPSVSVHPELEFALRMPASAAVAPPCSWMVPPPPDPTSSTLSPSSGTAPSAQFAESAQLPLCTIHVHVLAFAVKVAATAKKTTAFSVFFMNKALP